MKACVRQVKLKEGGEGGRPKKSGGDNGGKGKSAASLNHIPGGTSPARSSGGGDSNPGASGD